MRPSITLDVDSTGRKILRYKCEGIDVAELGNKFRHQNVCSVSRPAAQSLRQSWLAWLHLASGDVIEFSSSCTQVVGWQEIGSLNIRVIADVLRGLPQVAASVAKIAISQFRIDQIDVLIYEDEDVVSECGIVFCEAGGSEIVVATGISPGSVSLAVPQQTEDFDPEFALVMCHRARLA